MKTLILLIFPLAICASLLSVINAKEPIPPPFPTTSLYSPSEEANQLHSALFIRYGPDDQWHGEDRVDPLFWGLTKHLLQGDSNKRAITALDKFLASPDAVGTLSPIQRALLQNDLWRLFNWCVKPVRRSQHLRERYETNAIKLQSRLGPAIAQLALTKDEVRDLPNNLAISAEGKTDGLANFDAAESGWVALTAKDKHPTAPNHIQHFEGRSTFTVYLRLPSGRDETLNFINSLNETITSWKEEKFDSEEEQARRLTSTLPSLPFGTKFALVRKLVVINDNGYPDPTAIAQTVQIRTLADNGGQTFKQFSLRRRSLVLGKASLELTPDSARDFAFFQAHDGDPLEGKITRENRAEMVRRYKSGQWLSSVYVSAGDVISEATPASKR